jgi:hypothetical protein
VGVGLRCDNSPPGLRAPRRCAAGAPLERGWLVVGAGAGAGSLGGERGGPRTAGPGSRERQSAIRIGNIEEPLESLEFQLPTPPLRPTPISSEQRPAASNPAASASRRRVARTSSPLLSALPASATAIRNSNSNSWPLLPAAAPEASCQSRLRLRAPRASPGLAKLRPPMPMPLLLAPCSIGSTGCGDVARS